MKKHEFKPLKPERAKCKHCGLLRRDLGKDMAPNLRYAYGRDELFWQTPLPGKLTTLYPCDNVEKAPSLALTLDFMAAVTGLGGGTGGGS